jgi:hypothetical protein
MTQLQMAIQVLEGCVDYKDRLNPLRKKLHDFIAANLDDEAAGIRFS